MLEKIWELLNTLSEEAQNNMRAKCIELGFNQNRGKISFEESLINLNSIRAILMDAIEKKKLIQLPITVQETIHGNLNSIVKFQTSLNSGTDHVVNIVEAIEKLNTAVWQYGLYNLSEEVLGYQTKLNQLKSQELKIKELRNEIENGLKVKIELDKLFEEIKQLHVAVKELKADAAGNIVKINKDVSDSGEANTKAAATLSSIQQANDKAADFVLKIEKTKNEIDSWAEEIKKLEKHSDEIKEGLTARNENLDGLIRTTEDAYRKVEALLPGATSAGLAVAFKDRKVVLAGTKTYWLVGFIVSLLGLLGEVIWIINTFSGQSKGIEWWQFLLQRAPLTFPLIWLGWFFGRNYGHIARLEEDYAFKESVSRSFEGYKNQMKEVDPNKALPNLCDKVISILSESPLRVFERRTSDETPANSLLEKLSPDKRKDKEKDS